MKINTRPAPHIHYHENTRTIMGDVLLSLLVVYGMAFYYYGQRVAVLGLVSIGAAVVADVLCVALQGKKPNIWDFSAIVTGMLIPLMLPASIPFHVVAVAAVFGIVVAKHPFGGVGHNVFNPAAAGIAFAIVCFPGEVFSYPQPLSRLAVNLGPDLVTAASPAFTMRLGGIPQYDYVELALGGAPGPMGATNILVILACLLYLVLRGTVRWQLPCAYLVAFCALCWLFPRGGMDRTQTMLYEIMSGTALFGGVFMLTDPVTTPQRGWSRVFYGVLAAALLLLFRRYSRLEEEFTFMLLLMNSGVWLIDITGEKVAGWIRRRNIEADTGKKVPRKDRT